MIEGGMSDPMTPIFRKEGQTIAIIIHGEEDTGLNMDGTMLAERITENILFSLGQRDQTQSIKEVRLPPFSTE